MSIELADREARRESRRRRARPDQAPAESEAPPGPAEVPRADRWRWDLHRAFVPWVRHLSAREVAVWLALWNRSPHRRGPFKVGGATLGRDSGIARHHASAAAASLARKGLLEVVARGSARTHEANTYRLPIALPSPAAGTRASPAG